jgi:2-hydroxycyclohexanecarboxyl-CoA dehydrogenase
MSTRAEVTGRVAVVTGAASGIGLGIARRFASEGYAVGLLDNNAEAVLEAAAELRNGGWTAVAKEVNVADHAAVHQAFAEVRDELGAITVLITSAGIAEFDSVLDITPEKWERVLSVNLFGTFYCAQAAIPDMLAAGWGRIVTISSSSAQSGAPYMAHYTASKGGVIGLTKALARELAGNGITVNTIPPSLVDTPMSRGAVNAPVDTSGMGIPLGRAGTPDDIAGACLFLCSDDASYITGQLIGVNGGMYI